MDENIALSCDAEHCRVWLVINYMGGRSGGDDDSCAGMDNWRFTRFSAFHSFNSAVDFIDV